MKRLVFVATLLTLATGVWAMAGPEAAVAGADRIGTGLAATGTFNRIASFPVCLQDSATCDSDAETAAEIVDASADGMTLIYSDSPSERLGFVDIRNPARPRAAGVLDLAGEPTSVAVAGNYALVAVNTSADYVNVSGHLDVVHIGSRSIVRTLDLGGQPDAVAVSPDGRYAAVAIENERNEDLGDGAPPQMPAGYLVIVDIEGSPATWSTRRIRLAGLSGMRFANDPEPEYVDINEYNHVAVSLQENNHLVIVDAESGSILTHFPTGTAELTFIDTEEEDPAIIDLTSQQSMVPREPDGIAWIANDRIATADEGDLDGGSRGFTVFTVEGAVAYTSASTLDHLAVRHGHYPDGRSGNKGNEPENAEFGVYDSGDYMFVASERSSLIFVYDVSNPDRPVYRQTLPAGVGPEGVKAIPSRNLLVAASEEDARDDKIRSVINIYRVGRQRAQYPSIYSADRPDGTPIPFSAQSGLAAHPTNPRVLYSVEDSFYGSSRIFTIRIDAEGRGVVTDETYITVPERLSPAIVQLPSGRSNTQFDSEDLAAMINDDRTVNIDAEGIAVDPDGGFWIASEGSGTVADPENRPVTSLNFVFKTNAEGVIEEVLTLPPELNERQVRFGFEGVAVDDGKVYVIIQRAWTGEEHPRIGIYDRERRRWTFVHYELDPQESQNGGWVGLSDITAVGNGVFLVVERDNQGGPDAAIKRLYRIDLSSVRNGRLISRADKVLVRDLLAEGDITQFGNLAFEKIEGSAVTADGTVYVSNDNDGVDDNSGENQLVNLGRLF